MDFTVTICSSQGVHSEWIAMVTFHLLISSGYCHCQGLVDKDSLIYPRLIWHDLSCTLQHHRQWSNQQDNTTGPLFAFSLKHLLEELCYISILKMRNQTKATKPGREYEILYTTSLMKVLNKCKQIV